MNSKITEYQLRVLNILNEGGKLFLFEDGEVGLEDKDSNTFKFRSTTFDALIGKGLIKVDYRPAISVEIYTISETGKSIIDIKPDMYDLQQKDLDNIAKQGYSNNEPYA